MRTFFSPNARFRIVVPPMYDRKDRDKIAELPAYLQTTGGKAVKFAIFDSWADIIRDQDWGLLKRNINVIGCTGETWNP